MSKKKLSIFDKTMQNKNFKQKFEKKYKEFLLSELILINYMNYFEPSIRFTRVIY